MSKDASLTANCIREYCSIQSYCIKNLLLLKDILPFLATPSKKSAIIFKAPTKSSYSFFARLKAAFILNSPSVYVFCHYNI